MGENHPTKSVKERTEGSLAAVRKAAEHLSLSPGGGFHVVDTFASSKMHAGPSRRVRESLRGTWKNPPPSSEGVPSHPLPPNVTTF